MGSCGMDRLLTVQKYPNPEDKVRAMSVVDVGGGNAANVAHTTALLLREDISNNDGGEDRSTFARFPQVQLCTKVGDDEVGDTAKKELYHAGVDLNGSSLFKSVAGTTTSYTTVIVGQGMFERATSPLSLLLMTVTLIHFVTSFCNVLTQHR